MMVDSGGVNVDGDSDGGDDGKDDNDMKNKLQGSKNMNGLF